MFLPDKADLAITIAWLFFKTDMLAKNKSRRNLGLSEQNYPDLNTSTLILYLTVP